MTDNPNLTAYYAEFEDSPYDPPQTLKRPIKNTIPEDNLEAAALWMNNKSTDTDLAKIETYVKHARKKQEVFATQRANSSAVRYAELFRLFWQEVVPKVVCEATMNDMTPKELVHLMDVTHRVLDKEGMNLNEFLYKGPTEIPPLVPNQTLNIIANSQSVEAIAVDKAQNLDGPSREKIRLLLDALETTGKNILNKKDAEDKVGG